MVEVQAPDLQITTTSPNVSTARGMVPNDFQVAVVQVVKGSASEINQMAVTKQSPTHMAKLTAGEVMHLYVAGTGGGGAIVVIAVQFVVILALAIYCFLIER